MFPTVKQSTNALAIIVCSLLTASIAIAAGDGSKKPVDPGCENNVFEERKAHGVRQLVTNPALLSEIK